MAEHQYYDPIYTWCWHLWAFGRYYVRQEGKQHICLYAFGPLRIGFVARQKDS